MRLPNLGELKDSEAKYLYGHDTKEIFGRKSWERYVYMDRFCEVINLIRERLPKNSVVIDVGSAQGNFSLTLAKIGYEACGVDIRKRFIAYAKKKMTKEEKHNLEWIVADARSLSFRSNSVDCVLLLEILEHTKLPEKMIEEACRILKKGGYLVVSTINQKRIKIESKSISYSDFRKGISEIEGFESTAKGSQHVFEFQEKELLKLLKQFNLRILDTRTMVFLGFHLLAKLLNYDILSSLERKILKTLFLKDRFSLELLVSCKKC